MIETAFFYKSTMIFSCVFNPEPGTLNLDLWNRLSAFRMNSPPAPFWEAVRGRGGDGGMEDEEKHRA